MPDSGQLFDPMSNPSAPIFGPDGKITGFPDPGPPSYTVVPGSFGGDIPTTELPTTTITPASTGGYTVGNPPSAPGWYYDSGTRTLMYNPGDGSAPRSTFLPSDQSTNPDGTPVSPDLGTTFGPVVKAGQTVLGGIGSSLNWIEELAIRGLMVAVAIVLIGEGLAIAGRRSGVQQAIRGSLG